MINRVVLNETSYFGRGSRRKIVDEIKSRGYEKILVISDINLLEAIAFDPYTHGYYKIGERVGNAFKDGLDLK